MDTELIVYLNNILIFDNTVKEVRERTRKYLIKLHNIEFYCKLFKYLFEVKEVPFLDFIVNKNRLYINPVRIETIVNWSKFKILK